MRVLFVLLTLSLAFAPAPFPKHQRAKPADMAGAWVLDWGPSVYAMTLSPDGSYRATTGGSSVIYEGVWTLRHGRVYVTEQATFYNGTGTPMYWSVRPGCEAEVMSNGFAIGIHR